MNADRIDYYVNRFRGITPNRETIASILIELANEASPPTDTETTNDKAQYLNMVAELIQNQKKLPHDIKNMIYGKLWDLYECEPVKSDTVTITKDEYDALVADNRRMRVGIAVYWREEESEDVENDDDAINRFCDNYRD